MSLHADPNSPEYLAPRKCLREPIPEIFQAAGLINEAADAHLLGNSRRADEAIRSADIPAILHWTESLRGDKTVYPEKVHYLRIRECRNLPEILAVEQRVPMRKPDARTAAQIIQKYGWQCAYCGIPLIDRAARDLLRRAYPEALRWGGTNKTKHTAFMCMDNEFDHVLPHSRGGTNDPDNFVTCCTSCNCAKDSSTLEQLGLLDPRRNAVQHSNWDGLTRLVRRSP